MTDTKPHVREIGSGRSEVTAALELAEYLGTTFGASGAVDALYYYERLGWIGHEARRQLASYLQGLSVEELHHKKYDDPATLDEPLESLSATPFAAHARSLLLLSRVAGDDLEEHLALVRVAESRARNEGTERRGDSGPLSALESGG
jgi:archaellum component FlaD/FlaE